MLTIETDPMRSRVKQLVDEFITQTFTSAASSISINGIDSDGVFPITSTEEQVEYEPYDTRLASRVTSLYAQLESLTTTVAQLRRDAPARAAREYAEQLHKVLVEDDHHHIEENDHEEEEEENKTEELLHVPLGSEQEAVRWRNGDVAAVYEQALRKLLHLQGETGEEEEDSDNTGDALATTVGRAERAGRAAEVVEQMAST